MLLEDLTKTVHVPEVQVLIARGRSKYM